VVRLISFVNKHQILFIEESDAILADGGLGLMESDQLKMPNDKQPEEGNPDEIDKMMIMPKNFVSFLCIGTTAEIAPILLVRKVGDPSTFMTAIGNAMMQDPALLKLFLIALGGVQKQLQADIMNDIAQNRTSPEA